MVGVAMLGAGEAIEKDLTFDGDRMTERKLPPMPRFANEAEEAQWLYEHRDELSEDILSAAKDGTLGEGSLGRAARKQKEAQRRESAA